MNKQEEKKVLNGYTKSEIEYLEVENREPLKVSIRGIVFSRENRLKTHRSCWETTAGGRIFYLESDGGLLITLPKLKTE